MKIEESKIENNVIEIELNDDDLKKLSKEKCENKTGLRATMGILEEAAGIQIKIKKCK